MENKVWTTSAPFRVMPYINGADTFLGGSTLEILKLKEGEQ